MTVLLSLLLAAHADDDGVWSRSYSQLCFPSGLRVTVLPDDRQPVVAVTTVVETGSDGDVPGREGAAHLLEHLWFRSRPDGGARVDARIAAVGALHNAYTLDRETVFVTEAPLGGLDEVLTLHATLLADPLAGVDDATIAQEKRVVASELARAGGVHPTDLVRFLPADFLPGRPAGLGPSRPASLAAITPEDLRQRAHAAYAPGTTSLVVSGRVTAERVRDAILRRYRPSLLAVGPDGPSACAPPGRTGIADPPERAPGPPTIVPGPVDEPWLLVGWALPAAFSAEEPVAELASWVVRERLGDFAESARGIPAPRCHLQPGREASALLCLFHAGSSGGAGALAAKVRTWLDTQRYQGFPEGDPVTIPVGGGLAWDEPPLTDRALGWAQAGIVARISALSSLRSDDHLSDALSAHVLGAPTWYLDALSALRTAETHHVRRVVETWLGPEAMVAVVLVPEAERLSTGPWLPDPGPVPTAPAPPAPAWAASPAELPDQEGRLQNGLRLVVVPQPLPVAHVALALDRSAATEPSPGLDDWSRYILRVGHFPLLSGPVEATLAAQGASTWMERRGASLVLRATGTSASWEAQVDALGWTAEQARLPADPDLLAWARKEVGRRAKAEARDDVTAARVAALVHLLGPGHPSAVGDAGRLALGSRAQPTVLRTYHDATWRPDRATLVVVGPVDLAEVRAVAARAFGGWKAPTTPTVRAPARELPTPDRLWLSARADRVTADVTVSCRVPDDPATAVLARDVLDARLWAALRESSVASYDPGSSLVGPPGAPILEVGATVRPDAAAGAVTAVLDVLASLAGDALGADEVARLRDRAARAAPLARISGGDVVGAVIHPPPAIDGVTAEALRAWFGACAGHEAVVVVGPDRDPLAALRGDAPRAR